MTTDRKKNINYIVMVVSSVLCFIALLFVCFASTETLTKVVFKITPIAGGLFLLILVVTVTVSILIKATPKKDGKQPLIFQVPESNRFVYRWAILTGPGNPLEGRSFDEKGIMQIDKLKNELKEKGKEGEELENALWQARAPKGYKEWREGWAVFIPGIWIAHGNVSLKPIQRDLKKVEVLSRDQQRMEVDVQITRQIKSPARFIASVEGRTIEEKIKSIEEYEKAFVHTALNRICNFFSAREIVSLMVEISEDEEKRLKELGQVDFEKEEGEEREGKNKKPYIALKTSVIPKKPLFHGDKIQLGYWAREQMNEGLNFKWLYGTEIIQLGIQRAYAPDEVQAALGRKTAAEIEKEAAKDEAAAIRKVIKETGADPNVVMFTQALADLLRPFVSKGKASNKEE